MDPIAAATSSSAVPKIGLTTISTVSVMVVLMIKNNTRYKDFFTKDGFEKEDEEENMKGFIRRSCQIPKESLLMQKESKKED